MEQRSSMWMISSSNMPWKVGKDLWETWDFPHGDACQIQWLKLNYTKFHSAYMRRNSNGGTNINICSCCWSFSDFVFTGIAAILYECRLGCLENEIPKETKDYINALHLMFSSFKTTMYAGAIPKWLRPVIPKPWEEFCHSWDGLFKFSK